MNPIWSVRHCARRAPAGFLLFTLACAAPVRPAENNWGRWGPNDQLGTLNYITPAVLVKAATLPRRGAVFSLALPIAANQPGPERRISFFALQTGQNAGRQPGSLSEALLLPTRATTHWDGLAHAFGDGAIYNGYDAEKNVTSSGALRNGIHHAAGRIVTRGVLLDVARFKATDHLAPGYIISRADLEDTVRQNRIECQPGDAILIRTGWIATFDRRDPARFHGAQPGLGWEATRWLRDVRASVVALDNLNAEVSPPDSNAAKAIGHPNFDQPVTYELIRNQGMLVGQLFSLEALAADCAADRIYEFFFAASPLRIVNGTASPINPVAIK
jgi:kynurenine formamidase